MSLGSECTVQERTVLLQHSKFESSHKDEMRVLLLVPVVRALVVPVVLLLPLVCNRDR